MTPACPRCGTSDHTAPVPQMHADTAVAPQARALLAPPPEPAPPPVKQSTATTVVFVIGWVLGALGVAQLLATVADHRAGLSGLDWVAVLVGPFVLPGILLAGAAGMRAGSLNRGRREAERTLYELQTRWQGLHRVWQAGWLCRTCGVAFFPEGAVGADSPASPAIAPADYQLWVSSAATRNQGPGSTAAWTAPASTACPKCGAAEHAVPIPQALADTVQPVGVSASELLAAPVPERAGRRGPAESPTNLARRRQVWQAGWLCRDCLVAFYPAGVIAPDSPASGAIPVQRFQAWVRTAAQPEAVAP